MATNSYRMMSYPLRALTEIELLGHIILTITADPWDLISHMPSPEPIAVAAERNRGGRRIDIMC